MILITGASGRVGTAAVRALLRAGMPVRVFVRDPDKLKEAPPELEVCQGDLSDTRSVTRALQGISSALVVMGNHPDQATLERQFASLAAQAGVGHLVKVSSMEAASDARAVLPKNHYETEQYIAGLGLDWTFLRPNYYMQNMLMFAASIAQANRFALPLSCAKTAMIDARDVGEVAARVLSEAGHERQIYRLTGPKLLDFHEVAERMSAVLGRHVEYVEQTAEDFRAVLERVIPSRWQLDAVCELFGEIAAGSLEEQTSTVEHLLGRPPVDLETFLTQFKTAFSPNSFA